ncbi:MAG: hypothetical protein Q9182_000159 [Xanthomendoza sp. 2 TL-2023]
MGKRKRVAEINNLSTHTVSKETTNGTSAIKKAKYENQSSITLQIITGTYDRVLHGITATVVFKQHDTAGNDPNVEFADTFLFNAHGSAIRCLALSPPSKSDKVILASGSSDQTINLYHISARQLSKRRGGKSLVPSLAGRTIVENPKNRELGSLRHHAASINALKFPTRSKLLSTADDSTIGIARTRDWTVLSSIKVPIPKAHGRPSGDTAPRGGTPAGVNDFAIHPSLKLMLSVSKGERCMRLWNLVTGKKAGVLNFEKALLQAVGQGRWGKGEGFKVEWNSHGEEFVVGFENGAVVYGLDSKPRGVIITSPPSKIHQIHYIDVDVNESGNVSVLAVSTEDGRVVFFSTTVHGVPNEPSEIPIFAAIGQIGREIEGPGSRVKDFEYLKAAGDQRALVASFIVTSGSDGTIGVWNLDLRARLEKLQLSDHAAGASGGVNGKRDKPVVSGTVPEVGRLLSKYETGNRITCLKAFIMADTNDEEDVNGPIPSADMKTNGGIMSDESLDSSA